jgi:calcineurin-like phosphoesterase family protein
MAIFVLSDTHFNHANIIKYSQRPFADLEEMNSTLISNWNSAISPEDMVLFIGDFAMNSHEYFLERVNGNIMFIRGNHDKRFNVKMRDKKYFHYGGIEFLLIHDPSYIPNSYRGWVIHGHHHNNYPDDYPFFDPRYRKFNVSVDLTGYKPVPMDYIAHLVRTGTEKIVSLP